MDSATAQLWLGGQDFALTSVPLPQLRDGELLVRINAATVCGSDRHTVLGRRPGETPSILGHEGVGTVVASKRSDVSKGERIVFSVTAPCGACARCRAGFTAKCLNVRKIGHELFDSCWRLSGTYSTHIHLLAGHPVSAVPDEIGSAQASVAGCAIATVMAVMEAAGDFSGKTVLVNGVGMLGLVAIVEAKRRGAGLVIGCDMNRLSLDAADGVADRLVTSAKGGTADIVLELSGAIGGVVDSLAACKVGGTVVLAGSVTPAGTVKIDPEWVVRGWRSITGVHNYEPRHLANAVEFLGAAGRMLPWELVLAGPIPFDALPGEFQNPSAGLRTVVVG
ncbi:alcohol dehydrogenase catalytic domain-containing protein [Corynebacterium liangguodongii]|uniref:alcohol dehydrogenase n=1 Tax=Corynebacterium liangguodongii TaxID=2079535 RepID=A0A2S0WFN8_9CORY|nr:alcohol dehydrogenase catalytic domain-containing protein [Corynebacterium liangguodongii]AWB84482.1 dehydrogenase [Corynebacterium liangguodongii]PWB98700.1 dehydrogenase [Corynebacterium liangguodongii]